VWVLCREKERGAEAVRGEEGEEEMSTRER
jgi:hypothetical protein